MKPGLALNVHQQLTLTPQLQHAIRLLQLSTVELREEIQQALEKNPLLESEEEQQEVEDHRKEDELTAKEHEVDFDETELPKDLPVDTVWEDIYQTGSLGKSAIAKEDGHTDWQPSTQEDLHTYLTWQLELTPMSKRDRTIATAIIEAIIEDGFLSCPLEDIQEAVTDSQDDHVEIDEIEAVLHLIQHFDPMGVGARDLRECLLVQLTALPEETPLRQEAIEVVSHHIDLLAHHDYAQLQKKTKIKRDKLVQVVELIQHLNPRPGNQLPQTSNDYVIPDVLVQRVNQRWQVELNIDSLPKVRINPNYASLIKRADKSDDNTFLRNHLQEARWFLKSIQSRNETLLKVASAIVEKQQGFLEHGATAMKPMILKDIAEAVDMHESTISRVTNQKYIHTPQGVFELKYFFSSHVGDEDSTAVSSTAIRARIKQLVEAEMPEHPLSDHKIADLLANEGVKIARRTVAKYREAMRIPPSNERKAIV